jgi:two-component system, LytTR family, sensor kinase
MPDIGRDRVAKHAILWLVSFVLNYISFEAIYKDNFFVNALGVASGVFQAIIIFYFLGYHIFPKYLYSFRFVTLLIWLVTVFYLIYLYNYILFYSFQPYSQGYNNKSVSYVEKIWQEYLKPNGLLGCFTSLKVTLWNYGISFFYVTILLAGKTTQDILSYRQRNAKLEFDKVKLERDKLLLEQNNLQLEVDFLRSQINPHFLFNTLNSIYAEIIDTNEQAATRLAMLATLMRYGLYEANTDRVPLDHELNYIQTYLELEKIRHGNQVRIDLTQQGDFATYQIAPLLLISFVENAFKHGINKSKAHAFLSVSASMEGEVFRFTVVNTVAEQAPKTGPGGIGLTNTRKRLDLLYPSRHTLDVKEREGEFQVLLTIHFPES